MVGFLKTLVMVALLNWNLNYDFYGVPRTGKYAGDKPDIGAIEYIPINSLPLAPKNLKILNKGD